MPVTIRSAALVGIDAVPVTVEADVAKGLPNFVIVGLPDASVRESRERIRTALRNAGLPFPRTRITVNLAPADIRKEGPAYDLPIAVAVLAASGAFTPRDDGRARVFIGELGLDGGVRPVPGTLAVAMMAGALAGAEVYVPAANAEEASLAGCATVYAVASVAELLAHLSGGAELAPFVPGAAHAVERGCAVDFASIAGQRHAKRALEIAAAGAHNVLLSGPPGSGKTLLARALPGILPAMTRTEALEVTRIASVVAAGGAQGVASARPFRSPHHTASSTAIIGGGPLPKPGEVTLAHRGVLFLDELPEFSRAAMEGLRQPLEDGYVTVSRTGGTMRFPASFMLVAAQNPCPCGNAFDPMAQCACSPVRVANYGRRVSGPLLDRIDMRVDVPRMDASAVLRPERAEDSAAVRARVEEARARQRRRYALLGLGANAELRDTDIRRFCPLDAECEALLTDAARRLGFSARAITRTVRLARTIADLDGTDAIVAVHLAESLHFREKQAV